jgi:kinesin family protein 11
MQPSRSGAVSPAESMASVATHNGKRKERDFDHDEEETNINVVVRCRGRNEREVRENSGVVLSTDGVRGQSLTLAMGPSALSNKTYHFDKVFSSAADQVMIYDDVVTPILDEVSSQHSSCALLTSVDACRIQLHNLRLRTNGNGKDIYDVWRHE